jgi:hypothetical protein
LLEELDRSIRFSAVTKLGDALDESKETKWFATQRQEKSNDDCNRQGRQHWIYRRQRVPAL